MWKCECGAGNEEEALACINCGQERGVIAGTLPTPEELFTGQPPTPPTEVGFEEAPREGGFEEVYPPSEEEFFGGEERERGPIVRKVFRIIVVSVMSILIVAISIYAFVQIGGIKEAVFLNYLRQCIGIWIRCIILTQAVVIIGIILLWLLQESKLAKS